MLILVGVGHVFDLREPIRSLIHLRRPAVVGLELDPGRYFALRHPGPRGGLPLPYKLAAAMQRRIAHEYGTEVGAEMLAAADAAKEIGAQVALIDLDSRDLVRRLWQAMGWRERLTLVLSALIGLFGGRGLVEREMAAYEEKGDAYLSVVEARYPAIARILLADRNAHMAAQLRAIESTQGSALAVVGDGHIPGLARHLADLHPEVIRLAELRRGPPASNAELRFSFVHPGGPPGGA